MDTTTLESLPDGLSSSKIATSMESMSSATCWFTKCAMKRLTAKQMGLSLRLKARLNCRAGTQSVSMSCKFLVANVEVTSVRDCSC